MQKSTLAIVLLLFTTNSYSHGSSHNYQTHIHSITNVWLLLQDNNEVKYLRCGNKVVSVTNTINVKSQIDTEDEAEIYRDVTVKVDILFDNYRFYEFSNRVNGTVCLNYEKVIK